MKGSPPDMCFVIVFLLRGGCNYSSESLNFGFLVSESAEALNWICFSKNLYSSLKSRKNNFLHGVCHQQISTVDHLQGVCFKQWPETMSMWEGFLISVRQRLMNLPDAPCMDYLPTLFPFPRSIWVWEGSSFATNIFPPDFVVTQSGSTQTVADLSHWGWVKMWLALWRLSVTLATSYLMVVVFFFGESYLVSYQLSLYIPLRNKRLHKALLRNNG